jgi:uncharacterized protein with HEPN domain
VNKDREAVLDMVRACNRIQLFLAGVTHEDFLADEKTQAAVLYQLLVLSEAAKRISATLRARYSVVAWRPIARMRDKMIHAYEFVNLDQVWRTVTADVDVLLPQLEQILAENV